MPELPEVETIKNQLNKKIKGKKIIGIKIFLPKIIKAPLKNFRRAVLNSKISKIERRAKLIIISLSNSYSLLIHLKMTGQLIYKNAKIKNNESQKYTHLIFYFKNRGQLIYNDLRQFGYIKLIKTAQAIKLLEKEYGPEPLDKKFLLDIFKKLLARKPGKKKIKQFLMDQKNIAGIGNIYADEILFFAGIMPTRKISTLSADENKKIYKNIKKILANAIKFRGSSVNDYLDSQGRAGEYHLRLKVYSRNSQPCKKCKTKIQKIKINGRGTHFCPKCQK